MGLTHRVRGLLEAPELRKQIESLAKPLMRDGHMFQAQIHSRLERHPATKEGRRCRSFVASLETDLDTVIAVAEGYAPEFSWPRDIR